MKDQLLIPIGKMIMMKSKRRDTNLSKTWINNKKAFIGYFSHD